MSSCEMLGTNYRRLLKLGSNLEKQKKIFEITILYLDPLQVETMIDVTSHPLIYIKRRLLQSVNCKVLGFNPTSTVETVKWNISFYPLPLGFYARTQMPPLTAFQFSSFQASKLSSFQLPGISFTTKLIANVSEKLIEFVFTEGYHLI